ncbi:hypothetical protein OIU83_10625 [Flavobacterium sp. LS1R49]|uniref:Uncharacterized protein n=1 Tax=Flavobacterium shii TaxID=2987687 RepID=A0A9X2ZEV8_9FLAO|nr:hypothetical protein [Flavobacterium shii]MCV9928110.1 hypothetical protein [Flavobacterium shii]
MSIDHNRIKVADLEKNQPNKILGTNASGELEFSDINNVKIDSYNALDYTLEGKALDARQGKILKDLVDNASVPLASDAETQITAIVPEDKKVISRLKLFNWWTWIKSQAQIISGMWTFSNKVTLVTGTAIVPPLIIPNGVLTTAPQNGAIEKDSLGALYHTSGSSRWKILDTRDITNTQNFLSTTWRSNNLIAIQLQNPNINSTLVREVSIPSNALGSTDYGVYLFKTFDEYLINNGIYTLTPPTSLIFEVYLKGNNCKFSGNQYVRLYSVVRTDTNTKFSIRNNEIAISTNLIQGGGNIYSGLEYSELTYDNLGNKSSEIYRQYNIQSQTYSGQYGDIKLSAANISIEYRISAVFADPTNANLQNASIRSIYYNYSSLFLNLR